MATTAFHTPFEILEARFWQKLAKGAENECWHWTGQKDLDGYGVLRDKVSNRRATHISLIIDGRPRPDGMFALHSCDNPACVNPAHLRWGTNTDNMRDKLKRGRDKSPKGDAHWSRRRPELRPKGDKNGGAKLTPEIVRTIRATPYSHHVAKDLAKMFQVSPATVRLIRGGKSWTHV